jgi:lactoylglutathione lyase
MTAWKEDGMASPRLGYVILWVEDLERALRFYTETIGFAQKARHGDYVELETGTTTLALVARSFVRDGLHLELFPAGRESSEIGIVVPRQEVPPAFARAVAAGANSVQPPHEQPWGQIVSYVRDPDGHLVEICSPVG